MRRKLSARDYVEGVRAGDRATLARAITLAESTREDHQALARRPERHDDEAHEQGRDPCQTPQAQCPAHEQLTAPKEQCKACYKVQEIKIGTDGHLAFLYAPRTVPATKPATCSTSPQSHPTLSASAVRVPREPCHSRMKFMLDATGLYL